MSSVVSGIRIARAAEQADQFRRAAAVSSLGFFARRYLPQRFDTPFCAMHLHLLDFCERMMRERNRRVAFAMPPGHGKTSIGTIAHALWAAACHEERSIVIVRSTPEEARRTLAEIGAALEGSPLLLRDFPGAAPRPPSAWAWTSSPARTRTGPAVSPTSGGAGGGGGGADWGMRSLEPNMRTMRSALYGPDPREVVPRPARRWQGDWGDEPAGPTAAPPIALRNGSRIAAIAAGQSMMGQRAVGYRPTLVIIDDAEWEWDSPSGPRVHPPRSEYAPWLNASLTKLAPGANVLMIGSVVAADSVFADILDARLDAPWERIGYGIRLSAYGDAEAWDRCIEAARSEVAAGRRYYEEHIERLGGGDRALWPQRWSDFDLRMIEAGLARRRIRPEAYEARWCCRPKLERHQRAGSGDEGWRPCPRADLMFCIWHGGDRWTAVKMNAFDARRPRSEPILWLARKGEDGKWEVMDYFRHERDLDTSLRRSALDQFAGIAGLGDTFAEAQAALAAGCKPWRGEVDLDGAELVARPWTE